ncbi:hypothetical protein [Gordonia terrae]|uniref:DUF3093 domain-containing protein n=2 Tax=Gordonia terrae TaxID=2055 RepID=A0AAD0K7Q7_9ACTN|nr:hypothetical protein [Gordonia terrae]VTR09775.1 Uncharacterised protein [Clostridioides difficile]ANY22363.1 DUF3093 domain-containing protein [Gordonia terrae]AWO83100.1 DUF3093 domain-containing protein [Gordonia terrae]VTS32904.1 Uncharacterised protein [Gordonia terrae]GAB43135.1 hypothetical protein GOTRE_038_00380 [Gordonia terrae NBRC 100016]
MTADPAGSEPDPTESDVSESDLPESDAPESDATEPDVAEPDALVEPAGEILFAESGGSWWVVLIGPILVGAVLAVEITGPGQVHWPVLMIFFVLLLGFSLVQVSAARRHVSVELTETTLRQGAVTTPLADIRKIFPPNHGHAPEDWESASALGELHGVPRRRKGIGVELTSGTLAQAWARDVERLRSELTQAHEALRLGLPPRGASTTGTDPADQESTE